jgi:hypothetical protein
MFSLAQKVPIGTELDKLMTQRLPTGAEEAQRKDRKSMNKS